MDALTEEELFLANQKYVPPEFAYIYYNDNRKILAISPEKNESLNFLEVPFSRAKDFLDGKKDPARYDLEYFKTGKEQILDTKKILRKNLIFQIPKISTLADVTFVHNVINKRWEVTLTSSAIDELEKMNLNTVLKFYVTVRSKPQLLIRTMEIKGAELITKKFVNFESDHELDLDKISLYTYPELNSYGVKNA